VEEREGEVAERSKRRRREGRVLLPSN